MRGCAWLTGIERHALHASVCEQAGVACEALFKVEPSRSRRLNLSTLSWIFRLKVYNMKSQLDPSAEVSAVMLILDKVDLPDL
jgi:hypothetical protein